MSIWSKFFLQSSTSTHLIYEGILQPGFNTAFYGFKLASDVKNEKDKEEFKNDCELFSKTAKAIDELLETTMEERERWLELQDKFETILY